MSAAFGGEKLKMRKLFQTRVIQPLNFNPVGKILFTCSYLEEKKFSYPSYLSRSNRNNTILATKMICLNVKKSEQICPSYKPNLGSLKLQPFVIDPPSVELLLLY